MLSLFHYNEIIIKTHFKNFLSLFKTKTFKLNVKFNVSLNDNIQFLHSRFRYNTFSFSLQNRY